MKKNVLIRTFGLFLCFSFTGLMCSFAQDVVVKEVSLKDSYKRLLNEYDVVKEENRKSKEIMKKLTKKIELFANNIRMGKEREALLLKQIENDNMRSQREKDELYEQIDLLQEEKMELENDILILREEMNDDETYSRLKEAQKEIKKITGVLKKNTENLNKMSEETGKMHFNLATLYFEKGDYKKAANEYEEALKYLPEEADAYYNLALIYDFHLKDTANASKNYRLYLEKEKKPDMLLWIRERIVDNDIRSKFINKYRN